MFLGFVALSLVVGMSANAHRTPIVNEGGDSTKVEEKAPVIPETSVIDEVIWVVGDEPILKSDVEAMRLQSEAEGVRWQGDPDCSIPEQMAVQKLFLHQAAIDSIEVTESEITQGIDDQINHWAVIVVDDLASTMAAAIVTKKQGITLAHIVAGTRSFDIKMPKEINRLVIDGLSDLLYLW